MRVLVGCEFSGRISDAFRGRGHAVVSCDFRASQSSGGLHYRGDIRRLLSNRWDLLIAHPPCTSLTVASSSVWGYSWEEQKQALDLVEALLDAPIEMICVENPPGLISTMIEKPTQYIHPYMFGEPYRKRTGLWLRNLPRLIPTDNLWDKPDLYPVLKSWTDVRRDEHRRSVTFQGIANAMAAQWGR
jgi:site-specific DNA-cytosine methylase